MSSKTALSKKDVLVIALCGIFLVATVGSVGSGGRRRAKEAVCLSNLRRMGSAFLMFAADNEGRFMPGWYGSETESTDMWMEALRAYYVNPDLRSCPEAVIPSSEIYGEVWNFTFIGWGVFEGECGQPSSWWPVVTGCDYGSYGNNAFIHDPPPEVGEIQGTPTSLNWRSPHVSGGSDIPLVCGSQWIEARPRQTDEPPIYEGMYWQWSGFDGPGMGCVCVNRHEGYVNLGFLDASARKVGLKQLWRLKWHRAYHVDWPLPPWPEWMRDFEDY
jgi:hypothetical protein